MGCSTQVQPISHGAGGIVPNSSGSLKTQVSNLAEPEDEPIAVCSTVVDLKLMLEKPISDADTTFFDYVQKLVADYTRRSQGLDAFHLIEKALVGNVLEGCIFVGHVMTDMDSIGGAIGAAALFGGTAARAENGLNGEITYSLKFAGLEAPTLFDDVPGGGEVDSSGKYRGVCLVDHNEEKQMTPKLRECPSRKDRILGLIDHHAMAESYSTEKPLFVDVRPWGSMSTIVGHTFLREGISMPKSVARILLCAILSDTLELRSATTTRADRLMVGILSILGELANFQAVHNLAADMFRAKTDWIVSLGARDMVRRDQKDFTAGGWRLGIAVLEVTCPDAVYDQVKDITVELQALKKEKGQGDADKELHFAFCFIVDVTKQCSTLVVCGAAELELARAAFPGSELRSSTAAPENGEQKPPAPEEGCLMNVGGLVSRKLQFAPALLKTLNEGFTLADTTDDPDQPREMQDMSVAEIEGVLESVLSE
eukprot:TRINITY_DN31057_c0_g1_i1.p1 TRINITY_DN31057_c0_g1~~TRINITY_DN31057_c0_g1_i1.p1  ORF type:complete len:483 (-),score=96.29 TRINITY_DN31057_c0_g1_i1:4-1452(-)